MLYELQRYAGAQGAACFDGNGSNVQYVAGGAGQLVLRGLAFSDTLTNMVLKARVGNLESMSARFTVFDQSLFTAQEGWPSTGMKAQTPFSQGNTNVLYVKEWTDGFIGSEFVLDGQADPQWTSNYWYAMVETNGDVADLDWFNATGPMPSDLWLILNPFYRSSREFTLVSWFDCDGDGLYTNTEPHRVIGVKVVEVVDLVLSNTASGVTVASTNRDGVATASNTLYLAEATNGMATMTLQSDWLPTNVPPDLLRWDIVDATNDAVAGAGWVPHAGSCSNTAVTVTWSNTGANAVREFKVRTWFDCDSNGQLSPDEPMRSAFVTVIKVDIATDINNDGTIDAADEPIEESGIGEVIRVNDTDDLSGVEDDLQYMEVKIQPTLTQGKVWFTYDTTKVKIWSTLAQTPGTEIPSGTETSPNWNLGAGGTVPDHVYVEGLSATASNASINVVLHVKIGGAEYTDTILVTVTDKLGHYAFFAGVFDYLVENNYRTFKCLVDLPIEDAGDFSFVAVRSDRASLSVYDGASDNSLASKTIYGVMDKFNGATIIANGTFFVESTGKTRGRCLHSGTPLAISVDLDPAEDNSGKGWFGQDQTFNFAHNAPSVDPPTSGASYDALGGLVAFLPTYGSKTIDTICAKTPHPAAWDTAAAHIMGLSSQNKVLFFMVNGNPLTGYGGHTSYPIRNVVASLQLSGADVVRGLDGGGSVALAHTERDGTNLGTARMPGPRHTLPPIQGRVSNYVIVYLQN